MDTIYHYLGMFAFWVVIVLPLTVIAMVYAYYGVKTLFVAYDFLQFYKFEAVKFNPEWKPKFDPVRMYIAAYMQAWTIDKDTQLIHHSGREYKPFAWR